MAGAKCKEQLAQYELIIYQMAMLLHHREVIAIEITKQVLRQIWSDGQFFELEPCKQRNRLMWLVSKQSAQLVPAL